MLNSNLKWSRRSFVRDRVKSCFVPNIIFVASGALTVLFFGVEYSLELKQDFYMESFAFCMKVARQILSVTYTFSP